MAKTKWLVALLLAGVLGVVIYDFDFFLGRKNKSKEEETVQLAAEGGSNSPSSSEASLVAAAPTLSPVPTGSGEALPRPALAYEQLQLEARKTILVERQISPKIDWHWPDRDPFREQAMEPLARGDVLVPVAPPKIEAPEPVYELSAILVQGERRYAVIDGSLRKVNSIVNGGKVTVIERDYVEIKTAKGMKRLALGPAIRELSALPIPSRTGL